MELGYGFIVGWISALVCYFGIGALILGEQGWGCVLLALGVLGLLRAARHVVKSAE